MEKLLNYGYGSYNQTAVIYNLCNVKLKTTFVILRLLLFILRKQLLGWVFLYLHSSIISSDMDRPMSSNSLSKRVRSMIAI